MKKISLLLSSFLIGMVGVAQTAKDIAIIPEPVSLEKKSARFVLNNQTKIVADTKNADVQRVVRFFTGQVRQATGYTLPAAAAATKTNVIGFSLNKTANKTIGK